MTSIQRLFSSILNLKSQYLLEEEREKSLVRATHIVMAQHDSFRVASGSRGVDEAAALIGPKTVNHSIQLLIGHVLSQLHELFPLQK